MTTVDVPFWKRKRLDELSRDEWESLCDGCARCCVHKLEDEDSGEIYYTAVACRLLDISTCRCTSYSDRTKHVPGCIPLTAKRVGEFQWLPHTCAYRLIAEGKDLEPWHPLISGSDQSVHEAGISVRGRVIPEEMVDLDDLEDFIADFDDPGQAADDDDMDDGDAVADDAAEEPR